jgi:hypothetical protein
VGVRPKNLPIHPELGPDQERLDGEFVSEEIGSGESWALTGFGAMDDLRNGSGHVFTYAATGFERSNRVPNTIFKILSEMRNQSFLNTVE